MSEVKVVQLHPTLCALMDYIVHGILQARILEWVAFPFSSGSSQPRNQTGVSCIAVDSLPAKPTGKPKNTGVGSLSLPQGIFPTQESNRGLLHCRRILYQLSYQGSLYHQNYHLIKNKNKNKKTCNHFLKSRCISELSLKFLKNTNSKVLLLSPELQIYF